MKMVLALLMALMMLPTPVLRTYHSNANDAGYGGDVTHADRQDGS